MSRSLSSFSSRRRSSARRFSVSTSANGISACDGRDWRAMAQDWRTPKNVVLTPLRPTGRNDSEGDIRPLVPDGTAIAELSRPRSEGSDCVNALPPRVAAQLRALCAGCRGGLVPPCFTPTAKTSRRTLRAKSNQVPALPDKPAVAHNLAVAHNRPMCPAESGAPFRPLVPYGTAIAELSRPPGGSSYRKPALPGKPAVAPNLVVAPNQPMLLYVHWHAFNQCCPVESVAPFRPLVPYGTAIGELSRPPSR